jgi:hypothetical protein
MKHTPLQTETYTEPKDSLPKTSAAMHHALGRKISWVLNESSGTEILVPLYAENRIQNLQDHNLMIYIINW